MLDPRAGIRKAGAMQPLMALLKEVVEVRVCCAPTHSRVDARCRDCWACGNQLGHSPGKTEVSVRICTACIAC